jgi:hypothetical protein
MFGQFLKGQDHGRMVQFGIPLSGDTVKKFLCRGGIGERYLEFACI